jgi:lysophospholipase L1-like esterase
MASFNVSVEAMRTAAADNKVALADVSHIWANLSSVGIAYETLLANGLNHPNDLGHEFFAASVMELLKPEG